ERIEADQFDELPGEVFVRGFLKSYARALDLEPDDVLARYTASRKVAWVTPLPLTSPGGSGRSRRFGVAIAFVLLLILFTLALSIVLKPREHDVPQELSLHSAVTGRVALLLAPSAKAKNLQETAANLRVSPA
ncbi:MAG: helix-turn-helix transcriptional regulator, partial [Polyangiaceae bacterium]